MKENIPLLNFLRSTRFVLYVTLFTVLFLAPNTYFVFHLLSRFIYPWREIASGGVSLIVAASIMIFTLRKNRDMAMYYAMFEILISGYYYVDMIGLDWALIPAIAFTLILPWSVYSYTTEIDALPQPTDLDLHMDKHPKERPSDFYTKNP